MRVSKTGYGFVLGIALIVSSPRASAQRTSDKAIADALFSEGKKLIAAGDIAAACAKFEASLARVTQLGTQLALASCYEKAGKTASAWAEFRAAASAASRARDAQRQRFAEDRAAALEAQLAKLVIKLEPGYRVDGLVVKRDGVEIAAAELGTPVPVDPGDHTVEAASAGWNPWHTTVTVESGPGTVQVVVPVLGKAPVKLEEETPVPAPVVSPVGPRAGAIDRPSSSRRTLAYGLGGGGAALIATSLIVGAMASSSWDDARAHCRDNLCDRTGVDLASSAQTKGNAATALFVIGSAALATGIVLYVTSPSTREHPVLARSTAWRITPGIAPDQVGLLIQGGF